MQSKRNRQWRGFLFRAAYVGLGFLACFVVIVVFASTPDFFRIRLVEVASIVATALVGVAIAYFVTVSFG